MCECIAGGYVLLRVLSLGVVISFRWRKLTSSRTDEYNDLGPDLIDLHPDIIAEMWRFERENALKC
jgi:hypothetical protein